jgi:hypothetical protein
MIKLSKKTREKIDNYYAQQRKSDKSRTSGDRKRTSSDK